MTMHENTPDFEDRVVNEIDGDILPLYTGINGPVLEDESLEIERGDYEAFTRLEPSEIEAIESKSKFSYTPDELKELHQGNDPGDVGSMYRRDI